jgi:hypothetical protein
MLVQYIREGLAPLGVNLLCLEFNPGYNYLCFPELADGTFGRDSAQKVAAAAKTAGIRIVLLFMCLGHQRWRFNRNALLKAYPEFIEGLLSVTIISILLFESPLPNGYPRILLLAFHLIYTQ